MKRERVIGSLWSIIGLLPIFLLAACGPEQIEVGNADVLDDKADQTNPPGISEPVKQIENQSTANNSTNPVPIKTPMYLTEYGTFLRITINDIGPLLLRYDTGAGGAQIIIDTAMGKELGLVQGNVTAKLEGGLEMGQQYLILTDLAESKDSYPDFPDDTIVGAVGNGFFKKFAVGLNFRDREFWLTPAQSESIELLAPQGTGKPKIVPTKSTLGYLSIPCSFAPNTAPKVCLFDAGAHVSEVFTSYWNTLEHPSDRIVPTVVADFTGTVMNGYYQRTKAISLGDTVSIEGDFVSVLDFDWFASWCKKEVSTDCVGIIGLETVSRFYTVVDFSNRRLLLYPYKTLTHLYPSPFVGFGFLLGGKGFLPQVEAIVPQSSAEAAGIKQGDYLIEIDDVSIFKTPFKLTVSYIIPGTPGEIRSFTFMRGSEKVRLNITAEDLLPPVN